MRMLCFTHGTCEKQWQFFECTWLQNKSHFIFTGFAYSAKPHFFGSLYACIKDRVHLHSLGAWAKLKKLMTTMENHYTTFETYVCF